MKVNELSREIEGTLTAYAKTTAQKMKQAVKETADEVKSEISSNAPVGHTGKYAKSWKTKKTEETDTSATYTVHANKDGYRLAHLLEFGHVKRGGGRVRAIPHIKPAEDKGMEIFEKKLREDLE